MSGLLLQPSSHPSQHGANLKSSVNLRQIIHHHGPSLSHWSIHNHSLKFSHPGRSLNLRRFSSLGLSIHNNWDKDNLGRNSRRQMLSLNHHGPNSPSQSPNLNRLGRNKLSQRHRRNHHGFNKLIILFHNNHGPRDSLNHPGFQLSLSSLSLSSSRIK
ncbi:hypothetical protein CRUP_025064 [Coryphaenoides rupestris]|nr:hypothetical protein CRUP_025064 [Coryphaenoides rupestris]